MLRSLNEDLVPKVSKFLMMNYHHQLLKTNDTNYQLKKFSSGPWVRYSVLADYFSDMEQSNKNPLELLNGQNLSEIDFHIDASLDYLQEIGFWGDGEQINEKWWFKNSVHRTKFKFPIPDQVKIRHCIILNA